jgi:hypothetical protein
MGIRYSLLPLWSEQRLNSESSLSLSSARRPFSHPVILSSLRVALVVVLTTATGGAAPVRALAGVGATTQAESWSISPAWVAQGGGRRLPRFLSGRRR